MIKPIGIQVESIESVFLQIAAGGHRATWVSISITNAYVQTCMNPNSQTPIHRYLFWTRRHIACLNKESFI